jgi:hypothetical protein
MHEYMNAVIARNLDDYREMAIELCRKAKARRRLKAKLQQDRDSAMLFDTRKLTGKGMRLRQPAPRESGGMRASSQMGLR